MIRKERKFVSYTGEELIFDNKIFFINDIKGLIGWEMEAEDNVSVPKTPLSRRGSFTVSVCGTPDQVSEGVETLLRLFEPSGEEGLDCAIGINGYLCYGNVLQVTPQTAIPTLYTAEVTFYTVRPFWYYEKKFVTFTNKSVEELNQASPGGVGTPDNQYPHGYPYGYPDPSSSYLLKVDGTTSMPFRLEIHGEWNAPAVSIGGVSYSVNVDLNDGDRLVIDSAAKTVYVYDQTGARTNAFAKRGANVFRRIPIGAHEVTWIGDHVFYLTLIEERRAPRWI